MAGRGMTSHTHVSSTEAKDYLTNMNYSENFDGETSNHELQHVEKFVGVSAASGSAINKIQLYCESGVELWVDLKMDSNPQYNSDHMHMPRLTAFPQGSSPQVPLSDFGSQTFGGINNKRASDLLISMSAGTEINRLRISELASKAMEELVKLAFAREPLWKVDTASNTEILSEIEYMREFGDMNPKELGPKPVSSEASREIGLVRMNPSSIVQLLMNLRQWSQAFSNIVSRAAIVGVLSSTGVQGNYDGTLQVMTAEFHAPTPLVPTRESYFARYCKKLGSDTWAVVDVSLEKLFQFPSRNFRRQPSGCLVQEMPDGWSNVIWVEHVEVDNSLVHNMFEPLVSSGFAFCAKRWVATLIRQCQWLETTMARRTCFSTDGGKENPVKAFGEDGEKLL
ncbi:homeobox-leucine zipper protein MERISTEM L1 [Prunus persica]|uniref:homeobox-leucine zipper protein MERISTEM L1 n=1 Tax=Prunus persica TaxID=3760 RepID=UPI0009AB478D|nr:homeobox-leucine zipper protein MERISTEM L1 [Prunus persica]